MTTQPIQQNFFQDLYRKLTLYLHPGSLLVAIAFDLIWSPFDAGSALGGFTIFLLFFVLMPTIFIASFGAVALIQRYAALDDWQTTLTKGLILGILAAVPFSFIGTVVGAFWGIMRLTYGVDQEVILLGKLTKSWREIEVTLRRLAPPDIRKGSLDEVINYLRDQHLLSRDLADQLHELRKQRNTNIHEMTTDELTVLVDSVQAMQNTLRARFLHG